MASFSLRMFLLALMIILMFSFAGIALAYRHFWLVILFFILGNLMMGYGLYLKRKRESDSS